MAKIFFLLAVAILLVPTLSEIQRIEIPLVSPQTQNMVNFQINYFKLLAPTYNWLFCNKIMLYRVVISASRSLHQAASEIKNGKGNTVDGTGNLVVGYGNVVIGSNNAFVGLNSWCFTSDYRTPSHSVDEGVLAVGNYKVQLSKAHLILKDPKLAMSMIDSSQFEEMKKKNVAIAFFFK